MVGIGHLDLDQIDSLAAIEKGLGLGQGHVDVGLVVLAHADGEEPGDGVGLLGRAAAEGGGRGAGRDQSEGIPRTHVDLGRQAAAHHHEIAAVVALPEPLDRPGMDVVDHRSHPLQVLGPDAPDDGAGDALPQRHGLGLDHGDSLGHAPDLADPGDRLVDARRVVEQTAGDVEVAVEAQDLAEQLGPEPVHHRHDDDQHRHRRHHAEERDHRDESHPALLAPGAQVTQRDRPLPGREGAGRCGPLVRGVGQASRPGR